MTHEGCLASLARSVIGHLAVSSRVPFVYKIPDMHLWRGFALSQMCARANTAGLGDSWGVARADWKKQAGQICSGLQFMSKCDWGSAAKEGNWTRHSQTLTRAVVCAWAVPELLAEGRAAELAGQRAWLAPSGPLVHGCSPAKSPTVLGREQGTGLGLPHKLEKGLPMLLSSVLVLVGSVVNCGSWMKVISKNLGQFVFLHRGCKCSVLYLGVIQRIPASLCETTCSE